MIHCPKCGTDTQVTETRVTGHGARRRRICKSVTCGEKITTLEAIVPRNTPRDGSELIFTTRRKLEQLKDEIDNILTRPNAGEHPPHPPNPPATTTPTDD